jgi:hypothetical protein
VERCVRIPFVVGHGLSRGIAGGAAHDREEEIAYWGVLGQWPAPLAQLGNHRRKDRTYRATLSPSHPPHLAIARRGAHERHPQQVRASAPAGRDEIAARCLVRWDAAVLKGWPIAQHEQKGSFRRCSRVPKRALSSCEHAWGGRRCSLFVALTQSAIMAH